MKTKQLLIAFILLMMAGTGASVRAQVAINATNFPDDIFRQWVLDNCDTDGDGTLSTTEAAKKLINVQGKGIANLKGIEHFTAATLLNISNNQLTTVDLSKNTKLTRLDCNNNQLTKLNVAKNTALTKISCYGNKIKGTNMTSFVNSLPTVSTGTLTLVTTNPEANEGNTYTEANAIAASNKGWAVQDAGLNLLVVGINATIFPDDIFRGFVGRYDSNDDGILSTSEVEAVETINVSSMGIADLTGIKHFTNVKELYCDHNQLTSLSLSGLKNLEVLHCEYNQLTAITIGLSGFAKLLTELYCHNNQLTTLNILAEAPTTGKLVVRNTDGTEGNTVGTDANIATWNEKNWKVYSTDGSTLTELRPTEVIINRYNFPDQKFRNYVNKFDTNRDVSLSDSELQAATDIDVTNLGVTSLQGIEYFTEATIIRCAQNQLTELDLSQNTKLKFLYAQQNQLTELNLSKNTKLQKVICWNNHIYSGMGRLFANLPTVSNAAEIVVYNNASGEGNRYPSASQVMTAVDRNWHVFTRDNNGIYELEAIPDVQLNAMNFPDENFRSYLSEEFDSDGDGTLSGDELRRAQFVYCDGREITSFKGVEFLTELVYLTCRHNNLQELDVSKNTKLRYLYCSSNQLAQLDVTNNLELQELGCGYNSLSTLDVSHNTALTYLDCGFNKLTQLDVTKNRNLQVLACEGNYLSELNVKNNTELTELDCGENELTQLDVRTANRKLEKLNCWLNQLTSLDVSYNFYLKFLDCSYNGLTSLSVSGTNVEEIYCYENGLTSLNVSGCASLSRLKCYHNRISGGAMDRLVASLPTAVNGYFNVKGYDDSYDNSCTAAQAFVARQKGWKVEMTDDEYWEYPYIGQLPIAINETYFPDDAFRNYVSNNCDTDHDGQLSEDEALNKTVIDVSNRSIADLTGIEYFYALQTLHCEKNQLTSLDLYYNDYVKEVHCNQNSIAGDNMQALIDNLSYSSGEENAKLIVRSLVKTGVTEGNSKPTNTQLAAANKKRWDVYSEDGGRYTVLAPTSIPINETTFPDAAFRTYVSENLDTNRDGSLSPAEQDAVTTIDVGEKGIESLEGVEYFTELQELFCQSNALTAIDVTQFTKLTRLACGQNQIARLDLSQNILLENLHCASNQLTVLDLSHCPKLWRVYCRNNQLTALDVSMLPLLKEFTCDINQLTALDVSKNTALTKLSCYNNQLTALDVSKNTALTLLSCSSNQLTALDVSKNTALTELSCYNNQLTTLDVSKNIALTYLNCSYNQLTALDVSKNTALKGLDCYKNQLTALDVSKNTALTYLNCENNQLTTLDVSNNTALTGLYCYNNQLTALDVSKNTALTALSCSSNQLTTLDVSKNIALTYLSCYENRIRREGMDRLVNSLPETNGLLYVVNKDSDSERNFMTTAQYNIVYDRGWAAAKYENAGWYYYYGEDGEPEDLDIVTGLGEASPLNDNGEMINDQAREWYSLDGRRVLTPQKGHIYIRGGKKVVY